MSNRDPKDVDRLIQAALAAAEDSTMLSGNMRRLYEATQPFREPRPRVSQDWWDSEGKRHTQKKAIELTESVRTRLGPTAGVEAKDFVPILMQVRGNNINPNFGLTKAKNAIMALIAEAGVEVNSDE